jgi:hypothetical protein
MVTEMLKREKRRDSGVPVGSSTQALETFLMGWVQNDIYVFRLSETMLQRDFDKDIYSLQCI